MAVLVGNCKGFEWDEGNIRKNWEKHQVAPTEYEEVFFNQPLVAADVKRHLYKEQRYYVLGRTDKGRRLFIAYAIRKSNIRIISARDMNPKERQIYNEAAQKHPEL